MFDEAIRVVINAAVDIVRLNVEKGHHYDNWGSMSKAAAECLQSYFKLYTQGQPQSIIPSGFKEIPVVEQKDQLDLAIDLIEKKEGERDWEHVAEIRLECNHIQSAMIQDLRKSNDFRDKTIESLRSEIASLKEKQESATPGKITEQLNLQAEGYRQIAMLVFHGEGANAVRFTTAVVKLVTELSQKEPR